MIDTPSQDHLAALAEEQDSFRDALVKLGFSDDGKTLRGSVPWTDESGNSHDAHVSVVIPDSFPFAPPLVTIMDVDAWFTPTFHIERNGQLCLWTNDIPVHDAPWRDPSQCIDKISGWFTSTANGWPDDEDADLERYLPGSDDFVSYEDTLLKNGKYYRLTKNALGVIRVDSELPWIPSINRIKQRGVRRRERNLLWVLDVGIISRPISNWSELQRLAGNQLETLRAIVQRGDLGFVLVRYQRGSRRAAIVVSLSRGPDGIVLKSCESADTGVATRTLRTGIQAHTYENKSVAIVGCGAVGSYIAELIFRSGIRHITLIDPERYRPGNVIRHTADNKYVGVSKASAVHAKLNTVGIPVDAVSAVNARVSTPEYALELASSHDLVVDATADGRATALLRWASETQDKALVSACVQREGAIVRVDRFPLEDGESHLDPLNTTGGEVVAYEQGCGSPVSMTPPLSVVRAASIACQVVLDELNRYQTLPATIVDVLKPQPESPYQRIGTVTSA
ncbi:MULTISPECIES: ThiF family adenylyltransferase [unclassified Rhodococcus (in: high G+C Gram-positive bacteria)]|uniref:ThiF family adenylyltransferase n=1 Tax=unclassified Rhodococcus (in: high G+C Gram-positive bacteria) TaxID=192944 RepID=UPI00117B061E|nr:MULTISPECIES: ThiF family adenylyltransferase [unclassified Rhodococcus (in: high G+C Gram-positive bacteria)]